MLSTQSIKIVVLVTLLVATFIFSMIPLTFMRFAQRQPNHDRRRRYKYILSFLSCYSAGVFLGTCLLDLFPEVQDKVTTSLDHAGVPTNFPVPEFILTIGFFFILITEQFVLTIQGGHSHSHSDSRYERLSGEDPDEHTPSRRLLSTDSETSEVAYGASSRQPGQRRPNHAQYNFDNPQSLPDANSPPSDNALQDTSAAISSDNEDDYEIITEDDLKALEQSYSDPSSHSPIRSMILLLALSLHSIFEGLAIGLQSSVSDVLEIFAPVALHKSILAFSLGLNLVQSKLSVKSTIKSNLIFCVTAPIGIGIGIAIIDLLNNDVYVTSLVNGILQGLACGTFLYVIFFEILPHEFMTSSRFPNRLLKTLFMILGYATVSVLVLLEPNSVTPNQVCPTGDGDGDGS